MVKSAYSKESSRFFFNIEGDVGPRGLNLAEDVELVRFGVFCLTKAPMAPGENAADRQAFMAAARKVGFIGPYDADLGAAILAYQKARGRVMDSTVSVISGQGTAGGQAYVLQTMLANMAAEYPSIYPRIDQIMETGPALTARVKSLFVGNF